MFKSYIYAPKKVEAVQFREADYHKLWVGHDCGIRKLSQGKYYIQLPKTGFFVYDGDWIVKRFDKYIVEKPEDFKKIYIKT